MTALPATRTRTVRVDGNLITDLAAVPARVRDLEDLGYDGAIAVETNHDPFLPLALAAEHSTRVELLSSVAIALARSPMTVAYTAYDLQELSRGRLLLGLGSQTRPHIEGRFGMPWSAPAARMREFILALRAIWQSWETGDRLSFRGDFYRHTLMTPFFSPGANRFGTPRVLLGALGERMAEVAGEVADGILVHPLTSERHLRERTIPAVERGLARAGRPREGFQVAVTPFTVCGDDEESMSTSMAMVRMQIAFYGSTPAYRPVLELHGWGELQGELNTLSKQGRWLEMGELVTTEMVDTFAVRSSLEGLAAAVHDRFGGLIDRLSLHLEWGTDRERWRALLHALREPQPCRPPGEVGALASQ